MSEQGRAEWYQKLRDYFAARQPEWVVTDQFVRVVLDVSSAAYTIRESIDMDLHLEPTPQELERSMLLYINRVLMAHVRHLVTLANVEKLKDEDVESWRLR
jgi:hypothetical protein